jgi:hypothetical protein
MDGRALVRGRGGGRDRGRRRPGDGLGLDGPRCGGRLLLLLLGDEPLLELERALGAPGRPIRAGRLSSRAWAK